MPPDVVMVTVGGDGLTATPSFCHAMVGEPVAEQVKVACDPIDTVELAGCWVNVGGGLAGEKVREILKY